MAKELFKNNNHACIVFNEIMQEAKIKGDDVQSNQFLIIHGDPGGYEEGLLFDPGGSKLVTLLRQELSQYISTNRIKKIVLSHQDPDSGAGISQWLMMANASTRIYVSALWVRFVPHFSRNDFAEDVFIAVPDQGMKIEHNGCELVLVPAHFLHSPGNFQLYDPLSKILFSGDLGSSFVRTSEPLYEVTNFDNHMRHMEKFHQRYLASNKACRHWAKMAKDLDIEMIVPQHGGGYFKGKAMVSRFIDWVERLECGVDLVTDSSYRVPQ